MYHEDGPNTLYFETCRETEKMRIKPQGADSIVIHKAPGLKCGIRRQARVDSIPWIEG